MWFIIDLSTIQTGELSLNVIEEKCADISSSKYNISIIVSANIIINNDD